MNRRRASNNRRTASRRIEDERVGQTGSDGAVAYQRSPDLHRRQRGVRFERRPAGRRHQR